MSEETRDEWAIVELMGHRRHGAIIADVERFGVRMIRLDIPLPPIPGMEAERWQTAFYSPGALYGLTIVTEADAREAEKANWPRVSRPALLGSTEWGRTPWDDDYDDSEDDPEDEDDLTYPDDMRPCYEH